MVLKQNNKAGSSKDFVNPLLRRMLMLIAKFISLNTYRKNYWVGGVAWFLLIQNFLGA